MTRTVYKCQKCGGICFQIELLEAEELNGKLFKLCGNCFEESLEESEERKRQRIARENEY